MKKCYFYIDDVIWVFRDLARQKPNSVFDHHFLATLKKAHDMYGLKVQLNLFYRTDFFYGMDEFTLAEMPDIYKKEWEDNSDWLRLAVHSLQEFPDYPFVNADYEDVEKVFKLIEKEVFRFAGKKTFTYAVNTHWLPVSKDGCRAFKDCGAILLGASVGGREEYNGDPSSLPYGHAQRLLNNRKPETGVFTRNSRDASIAKSICSYNHFTPEISDATLHNLTYYTDAELDLRLKRFCSGPILNLTPVDEIEQELSAYIGNEFIGCASHEQYFFPDYFGYQSDSEEKVLRHAKYLTDNGYEFFFIEEIVE